MPGQKSTQKSVMCTIEEGKFSGLFSELIYGLIISLLTLFIPARFSITITIVNYIIGISSLIAIALIFEMRCSKESEFIANILVSIGTYTLIFIA